MQKRRIIKTQIAFGDIARENLSIPNDADCQITHIEVDNDKQYIQVYINSPVLPEIWDGTEPKMYKASEIIYQLGLKYKMPQDDANESLSALGTIANFSTELSDYKNNQAYEAAERDG